MQGVRLSREELIETYGISQRLAVRIGALLAKGLEVTGTLLEIGGAGSAVEKFLLHPELLADAESLSPELLKKVSSKTGADSEGGFAIVESEGRRVLALDEELLAEEGWESVPEEETTAVAKAEPPGSLQLLDRREARQLFSAEEIARIKLDALTGPDAETRISALRKLRYAPLSAKEKGAIHLRVLLDPASPVRSEAIRSLEAMGFNRDTADAIQMVFEGDAQARRKALRRIGSLLGKLQASEREIVLVVLLEVFRESRLSDADDPLLQVLNEAAPILAGHADVVRELTRTSVQHLLVDRRQIWPALHDLLLKLCEGAAGEVLGKLWEEIDTIRDPAPRAALLALLIEAEGDEARRERLGGIVVEELLNEAHDELTRQKLGHSIFALGPPAAEAMLRRFAEAGNVERAALVPFLDVLCADEKLPQDVKDRAARCLLDALKVAGRRLRMEILRTRVFHQTDLQPNLKDALARELIPMLHSRENPDMIDRAAGLLESLGPAVVPRLFDMIKSRPAAPEADMAVRSLGRIVSGLAPGSTLAAQRGPAIFAFVSRRVSQPSNRLGGYAAALGEMAASAMVGRKQAREAFEMLAATRTLARYPADAVEALGRIAACRAVTPEQRVRATDLLGRLVERPPDEEEAKLREIETEQGTVYELAGDIEFDSATLPAAVAGLEAIALADQTTDALRGQITDRFLRVWKGVAAWKIIWGPRSSERLALALGRIGADPRTEDPRRAIIVKALVAGVERLSVVRALGEVFSISSGSKEFNQFVVGCALMMLDKWIEPEIVPEELEAVLTTAAAAAARPEVSSRGARARRLRRRTAELLFDAMKTGHAWSSAPLARMRDCRAVSKSLRGEIADRLKRVSAIVPVK